MALPWKKVARVTRISRLVADLQSPNRHGGSLVVQTGFPTSLIDLFVKNRDRLKKPSSKKKKKKQRVEISDPVTLSAPPLDLRLNSSDSDGFWGSAVSRIENFGCRNCEEEEVRDIDDDDDDRVAVVVKEHGVVCGSNNASEVFWAILKMFIVVVFALGTKKLAVGITMSAFVLLLLECVGKRVICFLKPCSHMQMAVRSLFQRVWGKKESLIFEENRGLKPQIRRDEIVEDLKSNDPIEEIEITETNLDSITPTEEIQTSKKLDFDTLNCDRRWGNEEIDTKKRVVVEEEEVDGCEVLEKQRIRGDRRAKLKAKIKKLVPKKFRNLKKEKTCKEKEIEWSSRDTLSYVGEDKLGRCQEEEKKEDEEDKSSMSQSKQEERCEEEEEEEEEVEEEEEDEEIDDGISNSGELSKIDSEKEGRELKGNSGYLILLLIVLAGLVGGRIVAFFLIIGWCFMLKSVKTFRRFTMPMIRSPV